MSDEPSPKGMSLSVITQLLATPFYKLTDLTRFRALPPTDRIENWLRRGVLDLSFQPVPDPAGGWIRQKPVKGHRRHTVGDALQITTLQIAADLGVPLDQVRQLVEIVFRRTIDILLHRAGPGHMFACGIASFGGSFYFLPVAEGAIVSQMRRYGNLGCVVVDVDDLVLEFLQMLPITDRLIEDDNRT